MDAFKAFLAKDWVKVVLGGIFVIANGLIIALVKDENTKVTLLAVLNAVGVVLGITSGGTSALRSDEARASQAKLGGP